MFINKLELRKELLAIRRSILAPERELAAHRLCINVSRMPEYVTARSIALYWPHNNEIDCKPIISQALPTRKLCFLPILDLKHRLSLAFAEYNNFTPMLNNRYGISEPDTNSSATIATSELDIIFVPLVGFDNAGWRLGHGGGFYDATFADLACLTTAHKPKLIGLGYDCQQVQQIPTDSWDWRLDAVVTESQVLQFTYNSPAR